IWPVARREEGASPPWGCNRRATKPQAKFGATRRAAGLFRPDFVARSSQIHCGICSSLTPRLGEKSLAADGILFMPQTTKQIAFVVLVCVRARLWRLPYLSPLGASQPVRTGVDDPRRSGRLA